MTTSFNTATARLTTNIDVLENRFSVFMQKVEKINSRAKKAGIEGIELTVGESRPVCVEEREMPNGNIVCFYQNMIPVKVTRSEIKLGQYTFIGGISHIQEGNIMRAVPGYQIPEQYHNGKPVCDHCGIARRRDNTFVFRNDETGVFKQVGSTCLVGYFGYDPIDMIKVENSIGELSDEEKEARGGFVSWDDYTYDIVDIMSMVLIIVNKYGYVSNKKARECAESGEVCTSTAGRILHFLSPKSVYWDKEQQKEYDSFWEEMKGKGSQEATKLLMWGITYFEDKTGDYAHNMRVILNQDFIRVKFFSYLASLIPAYEREISANIKEKTRFDNAFVGEVKQRVTLDVTVNRVVVTEGIYGLTFIVMMTQTHTGNNLVWFASKNPEMESGNSYKLTGTVKGHNVREGKNQTVLTRCKIG